jgi:uncharacterized protein (TIGR02996 family)
MDDGNLLLAALHARPADDLAWLAFADWLEESGRPDAAELSRLVTLVRQERNAGRRLRHERQVRELLASGVRPVVPTVTNSIGMTCALIPPGTSLMGSPPDEEGRFPDETPLHPVTLTRGYFLGIHPVTQAQYRAVMGSNPSYFVEGGEESALVADQDVDSFPVESVTWQDAVDFCTRLAGRPAERRARRSYRLPTEAEWERACRGGISTPTPWYFGHELSPRQARHNFEDELSRKGEPLPFPYRPCPAPVCSYPPNAYGLYDMHGNVWEFCNDWFDADYYNRDEPIDPTGPAEGESHVLRGGSWYSQPTVCRTACRNPVANHNTGGFRVVLTIGA